MVYVSHSTSFCLSNHELDKIFVPTFFIVIIVTVIVVMYIVLE